MPGYSPLFDMNADGAITSQDGAVVRMRLLHTLPEAEPTPPGTGFSRQGPEAGGQGPASARLASSAGAVASSDQATTDIKSSRLPSATSNIRPPTAVCRMTGANDLSAARDLVLEEFGMIAASSRFQR
jgi:hypothetical protein